MTPEAVEALGKMATMSQPVCASGACPIGKFGCCDRAFCSAVRRGIEDLEPEIEWRNDQRLPYMGPEGCRVPPHLRPACAWHVCINLDTEKAAEAMKPHVEIAAEFARLSAIVEQDPAVMELVAHFGNVKVEREINPQEATVSNHKNADKAAVMSDCCLYRYCLERTWAPSSGTVCWIMLNPSTADANDDDPTIRKCKGFASRWGYGQIIVVNLYAFRATKPAVLWKQECSIIGPVNDRHIAEAVRRADRVVVAWGNNAREPRVSTVLQMDILADKEVWHLGLNKNGSPEHPLMPAYSTELTSVRALELVAC